MPMAIDEAYFPLQRIRLSLVDLRNLLREEQSAEPFRYARAS